MDDVMVLYMECIFEAYQEKRRDTSSFAQYQKLFQDLRYEAAVLVSFGEQFQNKLNRADATIQRLVDFQNRMSYDGN